jgi:hypothetical protein
MTGFRGYIDRMISRFSHDRILPWPLDDVLYKPKATRAGF